MHARPSDCIAALSDQVHGNYSFGENFLLDGNMSSLTLCVGDELSFLHDDQPVAVLQITSPRWPCYKIDRKHPTSQDDIKAGSGVRAFCASMGFGGVFCRVLKTGTITIGDRVRVTQRQTDITLNRVSDAFYGGENKKTCMIRQFNGNDEDIEFFLNLEQLAWFEWRERLAKYKEKKNAPAQPEAPQSEPERSGCSPIQPEPAKPKTNKFLQFVVASVVVLLIAFLAGNHDSP